MAKRRETYRRTPGASALGITDYSLGYRRAFAAMRDVPAVEVLTAALGDLSWGIEASGGLYDIWRSDHLPKERAAFPDPHAFSEYLARRVERAAGVPSTSEFAEAIFRGARTMGEVGRSEAEQQHALGLAGIGLALPHGDKRREIDQLLALPLPIAHKRRLLFAAVRAGELIRLLS